MEVPALCGMGRACPSSKEKAQKPSGWACHTNIGQRKSQAAPPALQAGWLWPRSPISCQPALCGSHGATSPLHTKWLPGGGRSSGLGRLFSAVVGIETPFPINLLQHTHTNIPQTYYFFLSFLICISFFPFFIFSFLFGLWQWGVRRNVNLCLLNFGVV